MTLASSLQLDQMTRWKTTFFVRVDCYLLRHTSNDKAVTLQNLVQSGAVRSTSPPGAFPSGPRSPGVSNYILPRIILSHCIVMQSGGGITIHVNRSGGNNGSQMFVSGGPARRGSGSDRTGEIPTLSE